MSWLSKGADSMADNDPENPLLSKGRIVLLTSYLVVVTGILLYCFVALWPRTIDPDSEARLALSPTSQPTTTPAARTETTSSPLTTPTPPTGPPLTAGPQAGLAITPTPTPRATTTPVRDPLPVRVFGWEHRLWMETRILLLVILAGAIGALVHALRSLYWYVGNRELRSCWVTSYLLLPFAGSTLGLVFYVLIKAGFFSTQAAASSANPFGFVAVAALVGMFSQQAALKLQDIAETIFTKPEPGKDAFPQNKPTITTLSPTTVPRSTAATLTVKGMGFVKESVVTVSGSPVPTTFVNSTELSAAVSATLLPNPGSVDVQVRNPTAITSTTAHLTVT